GQVAAARAGAGRVAALSHETFDHAVERRAVIKPLACQGLDALHVMRRDVGQKLNDHAALLQVQIDRVLGIQLRLGVRVFAHQCSGGQGCNGGAGQDAERGKGCQQGATVQVYPPSGNAESCVRSQPRMRFSTRSNVSAGTKDVMSPPSIATSFTRREAMNWCRSLAIRKTVSISGAMR